MRKLIIFLITVIGVAFITSCKKDEVKVFIGTNFTAPVITAGLTNNSVAVLAKANKDVAFDVTFNAANYGFRGSVTYTLEMDKKGNNFAAATSLGSPSNTVLNSTYSLSLLTNDLNNKLLLLQAAPDVPVPTAVEFRVKAFINDSVPTLYSPVISATYTPYYIPIIYNKLYVPGNYEFASGYGTSDWAQPNAAFLASPKGDQYYEGFVYFANGNNEFKFSAGLDWNGTNYGDNTGTSGILNTAGSAGNIKLATAGYYFITARTTDLAYSTTLTTWSIIGAITAPGYNWSNDVDMVYTPATKVWKATANFKAGEFKFRANHLWAIAYGIDPVGGRVNVNGGNLSLPADGNYTITLDFSNAPTYRYSAVKN